MLPSEKQKSSSKGGIGDSVVCLWSVEELSVWSSDEMAAIRATAAAATAVVVELVAVHYVRWLQE